MGRQAGLDGVAHVLARPLAGRFDSARYAGYAQHERVGPLLAAPPPPRTMAALPSTSARALRRAIASP
jgi:hypothetical protein